MHGVAVEGMDRGHDALVAGSFELVQAGPVRRQVGRLEDQDVD